LTEELTEHVVEESDLVSPVLVRANLSFGEEEGFSGIEASPDVGESTVFSGNFNDAVQPEQVERGPARLENDQVGRDEEG
jgi:hypothetical protein